MSNPLRTQLVGDPASFRVLDHLLGIGEYAEDEKNLLQVQEGEPEREGEREEEEDMPLTCELCSNPPDSEVGRSLFPPPFVAPLSFHKISILTRGTHTTLGLNLSTAITEY